MDAMASDPIALLILSIGLACCLLPLCWCVAILRRRRRRKVLPIVTSADPISPAVDTMTGNRSRVAHHSPSACEPKMKALPTPMKKWEDLLSNPSVTSTVATDAMAGGHSDGSEMALRAAEAGIEVAIAKGSVAALQRKLEETEAEVTHAKAEAAEAKAKAATANFVAEAAATVQLQQAVAAGQRTYVRGEVRRVPSLAPAPCRPANGTLVPPPWRPAPPSPASSQQDNRDQPSSTPTHRPPPSPLAPPPSLHSHLR